MPRGFAPYTKAPTAPKTDLPPLSQFDSDTLFSQCFYGLLYVLNSVWSIFDQQSQVLELAFGATWPYIQRHYLYTRALAKWIGDQLETLWVNEIRGLTLKLFYAADRLHIVKMQSLGPGLVAAANGMNNGCKVHAVLTAQLLDLLRSINRTLTDQKDPWFAWGEALSGKLAQDRIVAHQAHGAALSAAKKHEAWTNLLVLPSGHLRHEVLVSSAFRSARDIVSVLLIAGLAGNEDDTFDELKAKYPDRDANQTAADFAANYPQLGPSFAAAEGSFFRAVGLGG